LTSGGRRRGFIERWRRRRQERERRLAERVFGLRPAAEGAGDAGDWRREAEPEAERAA
jgi:hypothetical protein